MVISFALVSLSIFFLSNSIDSIMAQINPLSVSLDSGGNETGNDTSIVDSPLGQLGELLAP
jgi:hypothetical protein